MLSRIYPQQIDQFDSLLNYIVAESFSFKNETDIKISNRIREAIMKDSMQFWVYYKEGKVKFGTVTWVFDEKETERRVINIYSLKALEEPTVGDYKDAYKTLRKFAESRGVDVIQAYYDDERITELLKKTVPNHRIRFYVEMEA